ncbi:MAG: hypothetical protein ABIM89_09525 [Mycobacteriales bacterium]
MSAPTLHRTEDHPNRGEIFGVLAQMIHLGDEQLPVLADRWVNTDVVSRARSKALSPDSPLILEVLAAFDSVSFLFAEDLDGSAEYLTVEPTVTVVALKAIRDAIAAAYAQPVLSRSEHAELLRPWRSIFPTNSFAEPDFGPDRGDIARLFRLLPSLAGRCHDELGQLLWQSVTDRSAGTDPVAHSAALDAAWEAAVVTRRRRLWRLARRTATEAYSARCPACTGRAGTDEDIQLLSYCLGGVYAMLVRDAIDDESFRVLHEPIAGLIPRQRQAPAIDPDSR